MNVYNCIGAGEKSRALMSKVVRSVKRAIVRLFLMWSRFTVFAQTVEGQPKWLSLLFGQLGLHGWHVAGSSPPRQGVVATSQIRERKSRFVRISKGVREPSLSLKHVTQTRHLNRFLQLKQASEHMRSLC